MAARPAWVRWWILLVTSYSSGLQGLLWMSYSLVPRWSKAFLQISPGDDGDRILLWLLNCGPIAYILTVTCASATLDSANGLRTAVLVGTGMCLVASILRCVPMLFTQTWSPLHVEAAANGEWATPLLVPVFIAQIINAAAAPFTQASPSLLSQTWFGVKERRTATAIARVSNAGGRAVGFLLGATNMVRHASDMPLFLALHIVLSVIPMVVALVYFPGAPAVPPSRSAAFYGARGDAAGAAVGGDGSALVLPEGGGDDDADGGGLRVALIAPIVGEPALGSGAVAADAADTKKRGLGSMLQSAVASSVTSVRSVLSGAARVFFSKRRFGFLVIAFGLQMGGYGAWSGALTSVLTADGVSPTQASWLGFGNTIAGMIGGAVAGFATDSPALARRLRLVMVTLALIAAAAFLVPALALHPTQLFTMRYYGHLALCTASGLFRGALDPLFFEMSTELAFVEKVPAGTAGGALTVWCHAVMIMFLTTGILYPQTLKNVMLMGMVVCMLLSAALIGLTKQNYDRTDMDFKALKTREVEAEEAAKSAVVDC